MLKTLAIENYRSILKLTLSLGRMNLITGPNGSGKSNLYRALRLLAESAEGGVIGSLAREGGLDSTFWAGPEKITQRMRSGEVKIEGGPRSKVKRLKLGFAGEDLGYAISLGIPTPSQTVFGSDPDIKAEAIWAGPVCRPAALMVERTGGVLQIRDGKGWRVVTGSMKEFESMFNYLSDPADAPEIFAMREVLRGWRFYDHFRTDRNSPVRVPQVGTRTPVLHHDGHDLAAALQTIREMGDREALSTAISTAFPGATLAINIHQGGRFEVALNQRGVLRHLTAAELSDGTLRYLLLVAALLTPRPPGMMVLNEPETSLHPELIPALAQLIIRASKESQVWVVSHSAALLRELEENSECVSISLEKDTGETRVAGQGLLDRPPWQWPD